MWSKPRPPCRTDLSPLCSLSFHQHQAPSTAQQNLAPLTTTANKHSREYFSFLLHHCKSQVLLPTSLFVRWKKSQRFLLAQRSFQKVNSSFGQQPFWPIAANASPASKPPLKTQTSPASTFWPAKVLTPALRATQKSLHTTSSLLPKVHPKYVLRSIRFDFELHFEIRPRRRAQFRLRQQRNSLEMRTRITSRLSQLLHRQAPLNAPLPHVTTTIFSTCRSTQHFAISNLPWTYTAYCT